MRGATSLTFAKNLGKQFHPTRIEWVGGIVPSLEPRKLGNDDGVKQRTTIADDKAGEPIVAFSRPPPFSPFLGTFVVLSAWDSCSKRDSNEA